VFWLIEMSLISLQVKEILLLDKKNKMTKRYQVL